MKKKWIQKATGIEVDPRAGVTRSKNWADRESRDKVMDFIQSENATETIDNAIRASKEIHFNEGSDKQDRYSQEFGANLSKMKHHEKQFQAATQKLHSMQNSDEFSEGNSANIEHNLNQSFVEWAKTKLDEEGIELGTQGVDRLLKNSDEAQKYATSYLDERIQGLRDKFEVEDKFSISEHYQKSMDCSISNEELVCCLDDEKYVDFCKTLNSRMEGTLDLKIFQNKETFKQIIQSSADIFKEDIQRITHLANNPYCGIAALDIPEASIFDKKVNSVYGAAVVMGIFGNIGKPNIDSINNMPFSIYSASHENAKLLDSKDLTRYPPEVKLGFHNDGLFRGNQIHIPMHIMVYNMYINYRKPGNFKWSPLAVWDEAEKYEQLLKDKLVKIRITPNFYFDKDGNINNTFVEMVEVPIYRINEACEALFFLNGNILAQDNGPELFELVNSMKDSISKNPKNILIAQKERRALYLKNDFGFHARDIFEEPIEDADLTRVFIRAVDVNAKSYYSY